MAKLLFVPMTKVDVEKREVWGRAVEEMADKSGEVFDYATSRPLFDAWSDGFEKATDGKSLGNVRAMHGAVAAGKLIAYQPDDAAKCIDIGTRIVDDAEWAKVLEGVYTGFSIGGSYEKRWKDPANPALTRYTAKPAEISIVDNPCVPSATFSLVKADGSTEARAFKLADGVEPSATATDDTLPASAPSGAPVAKGLDAVSATDPIRKGLWSVARLASLLGDVQYLASDEAWDAEYEGDGSPVPGQLRDWLTQGVTILAAMAAEEGAEAVASVPEPEAPEPAAASADSAIAMAAPTGDVAKVDAPAALSADDALAKRLDDLLAARLTDAIAKATDALTAQNADLAKRLKAIEDQPAPPKGAVRAITKGEDTGTAPDPSATPDPTDTLALMKAAQSRPIHIAR